MSIPMPTRSEIDHAMEQIRNSQKKAQGNGSHPSYTNNMSLPARINSLNAMSHMCQQVVKKIISNDERQRFLVEKFLDREYKSFCSNTKPLIPVSQRCCYLSQCTLFDNYAEFTIQVGNEYFVFGVNEKMDFFIIELFHLASVVRHSMEDGNKPMTTMPNDETCKNLTMSYEFAVAYNRAYRIA